MKKTLQNTLKVGAIVALMLSAGAVSAQQVAGDVAKAENATAGKVDGAVRVIDNKGTIKYLQSSNGITTLTNTTNNVTTTTWQLGGTLASDTEINAAAQEFAITLDGTAGKFTLNGIQEVTDSAALAIDATTGYTLLVKDADGQVKKVLASKFVTAGRFEGSIPTKGETAVTVKGLPAGIDFNKVSVYRNGAKLRAVGDYNLGDAAITLTPSNSDIESSDYWDTNAGDVIEVQWVN
ncbi:hypothetical protein [Flavobacterium sp. 14A]|uniref:hypothetical protein n=1 Tax=Flavobacterium sp. 14A TaxID=2735896 RepID=UPI00156F9100|nr:hypothetical protein [Flavobacterium sp. 14A]NRT12880.1 hypothetical protein [Flavobacterium sp. 14A]